MVMAIGSILVSPSPYGSFAPPPFHSFLILLFLSLSGPCVPLQFPSDGVCVYLCLFLCLDLSSPCLAFLSPCGPSFLLQFLFSFHFPSLYHVFSPFPFLSFLSLSFRTRRSSSVSRW